MLSTALDPSEERDSERVKSDLAAAENRLEDEPLLLTEGALRKVARLKRREDGVEGRRSSKEGGVDLQVRDSAARMEA